ncbi:MAG TPA: hypothetical protein VMW15_16740 [Terracidiphilus sp.]|nr:hypothetical protein [Terracidiphilus sp.]
MRLGFPWFCGTADEILGTRFSEIELVAIPPIPQKEAEWIGHGVRFEDQKERRPIFNKRRAASGVEAAHFALCEGV